jgi:hypothetical protein
MAIEKREKQITNMKFTDSCGFRNKSQEDTLNKQSSIQLLTCGAWSIRTAIRTLYIEKTTNNANPSTNSALN